MNKTNTILIAISIFFSLGLYAQDTLVQWTFPGESALADGGIIPENLNMAIETAGGTDTIEFKNGATTKAARTTGWHNGANEKKWRADLITTGYHNLRLSSKVSSGGENPGPRDWKVQYRINGDWTDVPNSEFITDNDWETGVLVDLELPQECSDQDMIKLRWIMTSDTAHDGTVVAQTGISKIDDIFVTGDVMENVTEKDEISVALYPNPTSDYLNITSSEKVNCKILNGKGQVIDSFDFSVELKLEIVGYIPGIYFLIAETKDNLRSTKKFIVK
jgi:hypothetical protein